MNTSIKKEIKRMDTKICYHKNKVQEYEEIKKRLMQKPINNKNLNKEK